MCNKRRKVTAKFHSLFISFHSTVGNVTDTWNVPKTKEKYSADLGIGAYY